jgi:orotate phosphoribosyltransferase
MAEAAARPAARGGRERLLEIVRAKSLLKGRFQLVSGGFSDYYLDMKPTTFNAEGAALVADIVFSMLREDADVTAIGGLELGAVPVIVAVCARSWPERPIAGFVVRKETKGHGTDQKIDGCFTDKSIVVLIDDVTTKGGSVMQAVNAVRAQGATVKKIITIVDRLEGAEENLKKEGLVLAPIFTTKDLLG